MLDEHFLESVLQERFRLQRFRLGQKEILSSILSGKDALAVLPTGGGKSLCFQMPALIKQQIVVVVSPLIALMKDQVAGLQKLGIPAGCLHSGQPMSEKRALFQSLRESKSFLLYISPERVQKEGFVKWIQTQSVALFAIDEAHCVSQWGHDFREEYGMLGMLKELRPDVPILALTASATPLVLHDIAKQLKLDHPARHVHGFYRPNLYYQVEFCAAENEKHALLHQALEQFPTGRVIIYCGTRKATEALTHMLSLKYSAVGFYHAGMDTSARHRVQSQYGQGEIRILAATNAFGMGVDHPDVRLVVHYQMPANIDFLYQEMGRAGRDGKDSTCLLLYSKKDKGLQSYFIRESEASKDVLNTRWRALDALIDYCEGGECRHGEILTYFRDTQRISRCGHCDSCDPHSERKVQKPARAFPSLQAGPFATQPKSKPKKKAAPLDFLSQTLDESALERKQILKDWRRTTANSLDVPAFLIFSDKTLTHLALKNPQSLEELKSIYGLGEYKIEKFGQDILTTLGQ